MGSAIEPNWFGVAPRIGRGVPGALVDVKPLFCTPYGLLENMEDDMLFGGVVVVGLVTVVRGPKRTSRSSIPEEAGWAVVSDGALSSRSISDSSFLVEVEANSCGIGLAAATKSPFLNDS